jgi:DNA (cytosine-5)-methyltransferase 1
MIFKPVEKIISKKEINFLIEKVALYSRFVHLIASKNVLQIDKNQYLEIGNNTFKELIKIGVILNPNGITKLEKKLGAEIYIEFINSVNFCTKNRSKIGNNLVKLNNHERNKLQIKNATNKAPKLVDFFCGAGGLSLGFVQEGFTIDLANDYEDVCIETYKYNHPEIPENRIIHGDIRKIVDHIEDFIDKEIEVVVGGPPCQGFSSANKQRIIDDPRNELYKYFVKAVEKIAPKFVVMENVKGMLPYADQVVGDYKNIKAKKKAKTYTYETAFKVLVSDNFGVAQKRQRLIFLAVRNDVAKEKKITPEKLFNEIDKIASQSKRHVLADAIAYIKPLEAPRVKNITDTDDELTGKKVDINHYKGNENQYLKLINENRIIPFVLNHKARYANDTNFEIYRKLEQGDDGTNEKIKEIMPYAHRNHLFKDKYYKLIADKPCRTITAHLKMDCHSHIHPSQTRSITPREAARIQSFPDDYLFLGAYLKTYMQIGNAVPPIMANAIARVIKNTIS